MTGQFSPRWRLAARSTARASLLAASGLFLTLDGSIDAGSFGSCAPVAAQETASQPAEDAPKPVAAPAKPDAPAGTEQAGTPPAGTAPATAAKPLFDRLDKNQDGQVGADEVDEPRRRLFERLLREGDKNGDGKLTRDEFAVASRGRPVEAAPTAAGAPGAPGGPRAPGAPGAPGARGNLPNPRDVFDRFDRNKDGKLDKDEAPERMRENFDRVDRNNDGSVDIDELRQAFAALARGAGPPGAPGAPGFPGAPVPGGPAPAVPGAPGPANPEMAARIAERMFADADRNGDGKLTREEIPEERREMFGRLLQRFDGDGDGALSKEQFQRGMQAMQAMRGGRPGVPDAPGIPGNAPGAPNRNPNGAPNGIPNGGPNPPLAGLRPFVPAIFGMLDTDRDGQLSGDEIDKVAEKLKALDKNSDGKVSLEELAGARP